MGQYEKRIKVKDLIQIKVLEKVVGNILVLYEIMKLAVIPLSVLNISLVFINSTLVSHVDWVPTKTSSVKYVKMVI